MKNLTKKIEKFVSNFENHTFVRRFNERIDILLNKYDNLPFVKLLNAKGNVLVSHMEVAGGYLIMLAEKIVLYYRKLNKYINGRRRIKTFLINNISSFETEHKQIVTLIESRDIEEVNNWEKYLKCKSNISAILRANRRMIDFKILTTDEEAKSYINEYINRQRFSKKYELST
jgi:hypothetical protein